jgi:hypothetical protein
MTEQEFPKKSEISFEQEQALVDKIRELRPYLEEREDPNYPGAHFRIPEGIASVSCEKVENPDTDDMRSTIVITPFAADDDGFMIQDMYFIWRHNLVTTDIRFERKYSRNFLNEKGEHVREVYPSEADRLVYLAAEATDPRMKDQLHQNAAKKRDEAEELAQQLGIDYFGFTLERYKELMMCLSQIDPSNIQPRPGSS